MSGRLWNRCLLVWIEKFLRILAWSFLTTFLVLSESHYSAQGCTQYICPCILLRPHCCVSLGTRFLQAFCSRWRYVPLFLHVSWTTCILNLGQCGRSRVLLTSLGFCTRWWFCSVPLRHCCRMNASFQGICSSCLCHLSDPLVGWFHWCSSPCLCWQWGDHTLPDQMSCQCWN